MVDKIMAVRRDRCGARIGKVDPAAMLALNRLAFVVGVTGLRLEPFEAPACVQLRVR